LSDGSGVIGRGFAGGVYGDVGKSGFAGACEIIARCGACTRRNRSLEPDARLCKTTDANSVNTKFSRNLLLEGSYRLGDGVSRSYSVDIRSFGEKIRFEVRKLPQIVLQSQFEVYGLGELRPDLQYPQVKSANPESTSKGSRRKRSKTAVHASKIVR